MVGHELEQRGHKVEIINAGVPGHDSTDSLAKLITDIWPLKPDLIFLCHTWNDVKYFSRLTPADPYRGLPPLEPTPREIDWRLHPTGLDGLLSASSLYRTIRVALIEFLVSEEGRQRQLWRRGGGGQRRVDWMNNEATGPRQFALNLRTIAALSREIGAQLVLCRQALLEYGAGATGKSVEEYALRNTRLTLPELKRAFEISNRAINALADEEDLKLVDMHAALASEARFFHDSIHFSHEGSRAVSVVVADALEDNLRTLTPSQETRSSGE
jgi:lysophospholipase L1-like esterase